MVDDAEQDVAMLRSHGSRLVPTTGGVGKSEQAKAPGRGSPAYFAPQSELSRNALANQLPRAHDVKFRKSAMPVDVSMIANHVC